MATLNLDAEQSVWLRVDTATHNAPIRQIITPTGLETGSAIVTMGSDKRAKVWNGYTLAPARTLLGEIGPGIDGDLRAGAATTGPRPTMAFVVDRLDPTTNKPHRVLRLYDIGGDPADWSLLGALAWDDHLNDLAFSADGRHLFTAVAGTLEARPVAALRQALDDSAPDRLVPTPPPVAVVKLRSVALHLATGPGAGGSTLVAVSMWEGHMGGGVPQLFRFDSTGTRTGTSTGAGFEAVGVASDDRSYRPARLAVSARHVAAAPADGGPVRIYDHNGQQRYQLSGAGAGLPDELAFSPSGTLLAVGSRALTGTEITIHDTEADFKVVGRRSYSTEAGAVGFVDDWTVVSAGGADYSIDQWSARSMERSGADVTVSAGSSTVHALAVDRHRVAIGRARPAGPAAKNNEENDGAAEPIDTRRQAQAAPATEYHIVFDPKRRHCTTGLAAPTAEELQRFSGPLPHHHPERGRLRITYPSVNLFLGGAWVRPLDGWDFAESFGFLPSGRVVFGGSSGTVQVLDVDGWQTAGRLLVGHTDRVLALAAGRRWLITAGMDQVIRYWHIPDAEQPTSGSLRGDALEPALNLFVTDDGEWVIWSRSGYYDSSCNGDGFIGFHRNQGEGNEARVVAGDRYARSLFQPELISRILRLGSEEAARAELGLPEVTAEELATPPEIVLDGAPQRDEAAYVTTVSFVVVEGSSPTTRVWIVGPNGVVWEAEPDAADRSTNGSRRYRAEGLQLMDGPNRFRILARSNEAKATAVEVEVFPFDPSGHVDPVVVSDLGPAVNPSVTQRSHVVVEPTDAGPLTMTVERDGQIDQVHQVDQPGGVRVELSLDLKPGLNHIRVTSPVDEGLIDDGLKVEQELFASTTNVRGEPPIGLDPPVRGRAKDAVAVQGVEGAGTTSPPEPVARNLYLLAVGVAKHATPDDNVKDLNYAGRDAQQLAARFVGAQGRLFGQVWHRELVDEQATAAAIRTELANLGAAVAERNRWKAENHKAARDLTIFFFSGHGATYDPKTSKRELYLIPHDVDPTNIAGTGITVPEVGEVLSSLPTDIVVLIDACRAGRAGRDLVQRLDDRELGKLLHEISEVTQAVFASARPSQLSRELDALQHGLFTYAVLNELWANGGRPVAIGELTTAVQRWVKTNTASWPAHRKQQPSWRTYGDFPLVDIYS
jgi:hypothetical protein